MKNSIHLNDAFSSISTMIVKKGKSLQEKTNMDGVFFLLLVINMENDVTNIIICWVASRTDCLTSTWHVAAFIHPLYWFAPYLTMYKYYTKMISLPNINATVLHGWKGKVMVGEAAWRRRRAKVDGNVARLSLRLAGRRENHRRLMQSNLILQQDRSL